MNLEEKKAKGLDVEWKITVAASEINLKIDEEIIKISKTLSLPGFRPGKVPMTIVRQKYIDSITRKVLDEVMNLSLKKSIVEKKIQPSVQPNVSVDKYEEGGDLIFNASFQKMPIVPELDFKKISVEKSELEFNEKDLNQSLENIAKNHERFVPLKKKRKSKKGDLIHFSFEGKINNKVFKGSKGENETVILGSNKYIPGYEEQMIDMDIDEEKEIKVTFPDDYREKNISGKKANFLIHVKDIQERVKNIEIDDKLAKEIGEEDLDTLKVKLKSKMNSDFENYSAIKMRRDLTDLLLNKINFDLPSRMVDDEIRFLNSQNENLEKKKDKKEIKSISERRVKLGLILNHIGRKNKVEINDKDLTKAVVGEAQKYPGEEKKVVDFYKNNPQMMENLKGIAFEEKVINFALNLCPKKIKKCTFDELFKSDKLTDKKEQIKKDTKLLKKGNQNE